VGVIPKVSEPAPAFIHVDVDDLWAIAECYGYSVAEEWAHSVSSDALPRFRQLFAEFNVNATFFLVGRDLEHAPYVAEIKTLLSFGHCVANHSYSHSLNFRALDPTSMAREIDDSHRLIRESAGVEPVGFRAPGYAWTPELIALLAERNYKYDGSLMPSPFGFVFRGIDNHLQKGGSSETGKTQYPLFSDTWHSLYPQPAPGTRLIQLPTAASPLVRMPFQGGVCMRLGYPYFRTCFQPYLWNQALPLTFLFHAADLADFSDVPGKLFQESSFFNTPVKRRLAMARQFLKTITRHRPVITTEEWLV